MPVLLQCDCGQKLRAKDESAGRVLNCPACKSPIKVPTNKPMDRGIDLQGQAFTITPEALAVSDSPRPQVAFPQLDLSDDDFSEKQDWPAFNPFVTVQPTNVGKDVLQPSSITPDASAILTTKACPYCGEEILAVARKCKHCGEFLDQSLRQASPAPPPHQWNPGIAALLSLIVPGLGQMYKGQVGIGIIQVIGWIAAIGTAGYACLVINVGSFLHAALAQPKKSVSQPRSGFRTLLICSFVVVSLVVLVAIANKQKREREARQERMREINNSMDRALDEALGR